MRAPRCGVPYGDTPAYGTSILLTNKATYKIEIKQVFPCVKDHGAILATLQPGQSYTVTTVRHPLRFMGYP